MSSEQPVLVTGGTRGLGFAIVTRLAREGYPVVAAGRTLSPGLAEVIAQYPPGRIRFEPVNLSNTSDIRAFVKRAATGTGGFYGLVNNAAIGSDGILATMHDSQIEQVLLVNIHALILLTKYVSRTMLTRPEGRIVNISSVAAYTGFSGLSVYAASKAAVIGFTKSLARELGRANITVNAVAPGYMLTDMTSSLEGEKLRTIERRSPLGRLAEPADVAAAVSFLLGAGGRSITGSTVVVDAGSMA